MTQANPRILTINGGSSSIKFALFEAVNARLLTLKKLRHRQRRLAAESRQRVTLTPQQAIEALCALAYGRKTSGPV